MAGAVVFDVGHTLVDYRNPLNWSALYGDALKSMYRACGLEGTADKISRASGVLSRYNTRIRPRREEVACETIFQELLTETGDSPENLHRAIDAFFDFFQNGAVLFEDAKPTVMELKRRGLKLGVLTDVAYGMERPRALRDFQELLPWLDLWLTSVDVGFRKPSPEGFLRFSGAWKLAPGDLLYVGDEAKDILGANEVGMGSVLLDRKHTGADYGQRYTIHSLTELPALCGVK